MLAFEPNALSVILNELLGLPLPCHLSTGTVTLHPLTLEQLPDLVTLLCLNEELMADGDSIEDQREIAGAVVSLMSGLSPDEIMSLSASDFERLDAACRKANPSLFRTQDGAQQRRRGPTSRNLRSLETSIATLIECGHQIEDVKRYTLAQIERLSLAHARLAAERRINDLAIARAARASEKGYRSVSQSLQQSLMRLG